MDPAARRLQRHHHALCGNRRRTPPKGVKVLRRWHGMNGQRVAISESDEPRAMFEWQAQWGDLLEMTVTPCLEDADAGALMAAR